jgi:hypothetical protein
MQICQECGASLHDASDCQTIFDSLLVLEFSNPAFGEVHMLTVACFMIQHGRYSDEGLIWIEKQLRAYLEAGISPLHIRRQAAREVSQTVRNWKISRQPGARELPKINWSMHIADVSAKYQDAATYCELVRQWARITLAEMKPLLPIF